jgi:hypothetical protein
VGHKLPVKEQGENCLFRIIPFSNKKSKNDDKILCLTGKKKEKSFLHSKENKKMEK